MSATGTIRRGATRSRPRLRRGPGRRGMLAALLVALAAVALVGGFLWLRGSSLVSVDQVTVRGADGPDGPQIRAALASAARGMTTLEVRLHTLREAVAPFPIVAGLRAIAHLPHRLTIVVVERLPVAAMSLGGMRAAVAADGTVLKDAPTGGLPTVAVRSAPGGPRITEPGALAEVRLLAGAPRALLGAVASVAPDASAGLVATLRTGPTVRFGDANEAVAKWKAVVALLAVPQNRGAAYLDVTDPHRPAAGVSPASAAAAGVSLSSTATPTPTPATAASQASPATPASPATTASPASAASPATPSSSATPTPTSGGSTSGRG